MASAVEYAVANVPVYMDMGDLDALRMRHLIFFVGNSMRVLVDNELRPIRIRDKRKGHH